MDELKAKIKKGGIFAVYDILKIVVAIFTTLALAATLRVLPWPTRQEVEAQTESVRIEAKKTFETRERNEAAHDRILSVQENLKDGVDRIERGQEKIIDHLMRQSRRTKEE